MDILLEIVTNNQNFQELESEWRDLLARSDSKSIYLTWEWISVWWQNSTGRLSAS